MKLHEDLHSMTYCTAINAASYFKITLFLPRTDEGRYSCYFNTNKKTFTDIFHS